MSHPCVQQVAGASADAESFQQFATNSVDNFKHGDVQAEAGVGRTRASISAAAQTGQEFSNR